MKTITKICLSSASLLALGALLGACDSPVSQNLSSSNPNTLHRIAQSDVPSLGAAAPFGVFGGAAGVTNQGVNTVINGNIGTTGASTLITGFHSPTLTYTETPLNVGIVNGLAITAAPQGTPADFALAQTVAVDAQNAFNLLAAIPGGTDPGVGQLGGLNLAPGVYKSGTGVFLLSGSDLTLDANGDTNAVWVFQMTSSLTVGEPSASRNVVLVNGANPKNIFWQVGTAATINAAGGGSMAGTILANAGATFSTAGNTAVTTLNGRALGLAASVTLVNTVVNTPGFVPVAPPIDSLHVTLSGTNSADVTAVPGLGFLKIVNNGGHVSATQVGTGTIDILNNGGVLTAANTGNGTMTIHSTATGIVTVTNTGNGKMTVVATGSAAITLTHTGDSDFTYPVPPTPPITLADIPSLGAAAPFGVFGGAAGITNQGLNTVINGNIGTTGASTLITGFHSATFQYIETPLNVGIVNGLAITDAPNGTPADLTLAQNVATDALNAFNLLAAIPGGTDPGAGLLGGLTLSPGVYKSASGAFSLIGSDLSLDAKGDTNAVWVFQMTTSLTVGDLASSRTVLLLNGAKSKNVFWQVGSAATINVAGGGIMTGTIIANAGAVFSTPGNTTVTTLNGRALGLASSVTLVNTVVNTPGFVLVAPPIDSLHVTLSGTNSADVTAVPGQGFLKIVNNGGHVSATEVGTGTIDILNNGGALTATNTGNGTMTIKSTCTGMVTVTNTGKGNVSVVASGSQPVTVNHTGDEDFTYPVSTGVLKRW